MRANRLRTNSFIRPSADSPDGYLGQSCELRSCQQLILAYFSHVDLSSPNRLIVHLPPREMNAHDQSTVPGRSRNRDRCRVAGYCEFMAQDGWQAGLTKSVATQVRRWRLHRGLSAQQLSDRCGELGHPIPRPVLSNIENGRREAVTLAELLILSASLDVPVLMLFAPLAAEESIEILPGRKAPFWQVVQWFMGAASWDELGEPAASAEPAGINPVVHWTLDQLSRRAVGVRTGDEPARAIEETLAMVRDFLVLTHSGLTEHMREQGKEPPPWPPELRQQLDQAETAK